MAIQRYGAIEKSTVLDAEIVEAKAIEAYRRSPAIQRSNPQNAMAYFILGIGGVFTFFWVLFLLAGASALMSQPRIETNTTCWSCEVEVRK